MSLAKRFIARTLLHKIQHNDKIANRLYSPLPQVPVGPSNLSEWVVTTRPMIPEYIKGLIHYQLAVEEDAERIIKFMLENIIPNSPLLTSLGVPPTELHDFYAPIVQRSLKEHCSLLGFVGDDLVAVSLHAVQEVSPSSAAKHPSVAEVIPTKDYGPMIDAANFKDRAAKKGYVFMELLRHKFEELLPGARRVLFIEAGGVDKKYRGRGISKEMVRHAMSLAREQFNCDYVLTIADSKAAQKMYLQKLEFTLLRELKLDHFMDGPKPAFFYQAGDLFSGKLLCKKL